MLQIVLIIFLSGIFQRNPPPPSQSGIFLLPRGLVQQYESQ